MKQHQIRSFRRISLVRESKGPTQLPIREACRIARVGSGYLFAPRAAGKPMSNVDGIGAGYAPSHPVDQAGKGWGSVHAQSSRRIECCAELGREPSEGESACPRGRFLLRVRAERKRDPRCAV